MQYHSTRDQSDLVSAAQAILQGLAPDGGLYIMDRLPALDVPSVLKLSPCDLSAAILSAFFPDIPDMKALTERAYQGRFDDPDLTPSRKVGDFSVLELFHGPTCAFKDVALCLLPHLMTAARTVVQKEGGEPVGILHILTATSGDTGKAALAGFADVPGTLITVFYPHGGVSEMQRLQMVTQPGANVRVAGIEGDFDDAQTGVKAIFTDKAFAEELKKEGIRLSSANSINIGRLIPQIMYYFKAYADLLSSGRIQYGDKVNFSVPTGNFGDILAGYLAYRLGLPVGRLLIASNRNNVLTDFFEQGVYDRKRKLFTTIAPSMDILVSSNLERLLYLLSGDDSDETASYMKQLADTGAYTVTPALHSALKDHFWGSYVTDEEAMEAIGRVQEGHGYLMDPHTAIGWIVGERYRETCPEDDAPMVVLSTASPFKFPAAVLTALGREVPEDPFEQLSVLSEASGQKIPDPISSLKDMPERHPQVIKKQDMKSFVRKGDLSS